MKGSSLVLYIFVCAVNIFLFLPVIFYPVIIAPLHILLYILSYNWLFKKKDFKAGWNRFLFSAIPVAGQIIVMVFFLNDPGNQPGILSLLNNLFILILFLVSIVEFGILMALYSKYLRKIASN